MDNKQKTCVLLAALLVITIAVRLVDINKPCETWDEVTTYSVGLNLWYNIARLDFSPESWSTSPHPPFARYVYGIANGVYLYSEAGAGLFSMGYEQAVMAMYESKNFIPGRLLSVAFAAGTIVLIFSMARKRLGMHVAAFASLIYALLPVTLAHTKLATLDSLLSLLFALSLFLFLNWMDSGKRIYFLLSAVVTGLAISTKFNAFALFLLLPCVYLLERRPALNARTLLRAASYPLISLAVLFASWPRLWWVWKDPLGFLSGTVSFWTNYENVPEYFIGSLAHPFYYMPAYVLVTAPLLILAFFALGHAAARKKEGRPFIAWMWVPLLAFMGFQLLSPSAIAQGGPRYMFMVFPAFCILAACGLFYASNFVSSRFGRKAFWILPAIAFAYLAAVSASAHPYYLDYYNEAVGGPSNVYGTRIFSIGGLGEGIGEAVSWLNNNAENGSAVQLYVQPRHVIPPLREDLDDITPFVPKYLSGAENINWDMSNVEIEADYLVENVFFRWYMNESWHVYVERDYRVVHVVSAQGAPLAWVYKKVP